MNLVDRFVFIFIGFISGLAIGTVGIGAGVLFIPLLAFYGIPIKVAVAVGLALQLIPQSLPGFYLYYKGGYVNFPLIFWCMIGSTIGITLGAYGSAFGRMTELWTYRILFFILLGSLFYIGNKAF